MLAGFLILAAAGLRLAYLANDCSLDLAPDEAHYWDWSRHLDWSYYSKGPLVAWLIRASCELFGGWSQQLVGTDMLAVRLPAIVCGSLLLVSLYVLTVQTTGRDALALAVVAFGLTLPVLAAGSLLMTIDAPYTCCWGWALVLGQRAIFTRSAWAWPTAGVLIGLGILAKYTMVLWPASFALFLLASATWRPLLRKAGFWIMLAVAALGCLPILWWNVQHDWITLRHVGGQAGIQGTGGVHWLGPASYVVTQFLLLLGFWFVPWCAALVAYRPWLGTNERLRYLWWLSAPTFLFFGLFSMGTNVVANWPVTAYLSGGVLAAVWIDRQLQSPRRWYRAVNRTCLATAAGVGLSLVVLVHRAEWAFPVLARLAGPPTEDRQVPLRRLDPSCRLRGWRELAAEVDRARAELKAEGIDPVLAGSSWTLPGELGFYCANQPTVFSLGLALGDRHSQYDLWRPNPVGDEDAFRGRTFLCVGDVTPRLSEAFEQIDSPRRVVPYVAGHPVAAWTVTVCRGFRGVRQLPLLARPSRY